VCRRAFLEPASSLLFPPPPPPPPPLPLPPVAAAAAAAAAAVASPLPWTCIFAATFRSLRCSAGLSKKKRLWLSVQLQQKNDDDGSLKQARDKHKENLKRKT
jgi:hypothetical protein